MTAAAVAILAGGRARRLGGAIKSLIVVDGQRIIDRQLARLAPLFGDVVIVAGDRAPFADLGVDVVADRGEAGRGPLAGLDAALAWLPARCDSVVCLAGDMPHLARPLLERLRDAPRAAAVVPRPAGGPEPLCARYDRSLAPLVAAALSSGTRAMRAFLDLVDQQRGVAWIDEPDLRRLDPDLRSFINLNTPDDVARR